MQNKYKIILSVVLLTAAFATGRYTAPTSSKTEDKHVQTDTKTDNKTSDTDSTKHINTKTVEITKPDGTKQTTTNTTEDDETRRNKTDVATDKSFSLDDKTKQVSTDSRNPLTLSALAGAKISFSSPLNPVYGGMVSRKLLGPINMGLFGLSDGVCGVALGVSF